MQLLLTLIIAVVAFWAIYRLNSKISLLSDRLDATLEMISLMNRRNLK